MCALDSDFAARSRPQWAPAVKGSPSLSCKASTRTVREGTKIWLPANLKLASSIDPAPIAPRARLALIRLVMIAAR